MKILIAISDSFCANFIKGQGRYLKEQGHEVVIVSGPGIEVDRLEETEKVRVIRVNFAREISPFKDLLALKEVVKIIRIEKPDVINAGNPKTGFLFSLAHVLFPKIPLIFTLRGVRSDTLFGIKKRIVKFTEYLSCNLADKVIAISPSLRDHAINIKIAKKDKCVVLSKGSSNGIDLNHYSLNSNIEESASTLLTEYELDESVFKLLFVGRLTKDKGVEELIDAFDKCIELGANMKLILVGPIEMQDPLQEDYYTKLKDNKDILYLGKQLDVRPLYALADSLVLYSYREGFGNVVIESASFGVPTIVADIPGLRDTTVHMETGLVIRPRSVESLTEALMYLYKNRSQAKIMGEKGKDRIHAFFANEIVWSAQLNLYKELCE